MIKNWNTFEIKIHSKSILKFSLKLEPNSSDIFLKKSGSTVKFKIKTWNTLTIIKFQLKILLRTNFRTPFFWDDAYFMILTIRSLANKNYKNQFIKKLNLNKNLLVFEKTDLKLQSSLTLK